MTLPGHIAALCGTHSHTEGSGDSSPAQHPSVHFPKTHGKSVIDHLSPLEHILLSALGSDVFALFGINKLLRAISGTQPKARKVQKQQISLQLQLAPS